MPKTPDTQQWHFRPRSPFILAWIAIPFALGAWLVWFAVFQAGSLGWLFFLLSALCNIIGALGLGSWRKSWRNTRNGHEFIRLDEDDLSYCIEGVGAGSPAIHLASLGLPGSHPGLPGRRDRVPPP